MRLVLAVVALAVVAGCGPIQFTGQVAVFASDYANVSASNNYWIPVPPPYSAKQFTWQQPCALPGNAPNPCP